jgi:hypothetical protein
MRTCAVRRTERQFISKNRAPREEDKKQDSVRGRSTLSLGQLPRLISLRVA